MVVKWRRINGKNVQIDVPESKSLKEQMDENKKDLDSTRKHLMSNTDKKLTHQEQVDYNSHPNRKAEEKAHADAMYAKYGGLGRRTDHYLEQGDISEDDAFQLATEDYGLHYSKKKKRYIR